MRHTLRFRHSSFRAHRRGANAALLGRIGRRLALAIALSLLGCQSQEFEQVSPKALAAPLLPAIPLGRWEIPSVMLVVDASGSMLDRADGQLGGCATATGHDPTRACKWNDLRAAIGAPDTGFLARARNDAHFGLAIFPETTSAIDSCIPGKIVVPVASDSSGAELARAALEAVAPNNGTPLAATLLRVASDPALIRNETFRKRFVLLLTDGLPNCNAAAHAARCDACRQNPATCFAPSGCRPTTGPADGCDLPEYCLDDDNLVQAVEQLTARGVETLVVGFGAETASTHAAEVLTRAAVAGGGASARYFQASSREDLEKVLAELRDRFGSGCSFRLDGTTPTDPRLMQVKLRDVRTGEVRDLAPGLDWVLEPSAAGSQVRLQGQICSMTRDSVAGTYELELRVVELL